MIYLDIFKPMKQGKDYIMSVIIKDTSYIISDRVPEDPALVEVIGSRLIVDRKQLP